MNKARLNGPKPTLPRWASPACWPPAAWIALAVAAGHLLLLWLVADKHFLPKVPPLPAPKPPDFSASVEREKDPQTGEKLVRREYTVSTRLPFAEKPEPLPSSAP